MARRFLQQLMTLCVSIALLAAPLSASALSPPGDDPHCMTNAVAGTGHAHNGSGAQDTHHACEHCKTSCTGQACVEQGCVTAHGLAVFFPAQAFYLATLTHPLAAGSQTILLSRSDPPLLRPPV